MLLIGEGSCQLRRPHTKTPSLGMWREIAKSKGSFAYALHEYDFCLDQCQGLEAAQNLKKSRIEKTTPKSNKNCS